MKKKIYFIVSTNIFSGAESVNLTIINLLREKYDFYWVSPTGKINEYLKENNINHIPIEKLSISEIKRVIKEGNPDLLHATDYRASCICSLINPKMPIVSHLHNNPPWIKEKLNKFSLMYLFCSRRLDKILTVSDSIENEYAYGKLISKKIINVSNPVSVKSIVNRVEDYNKEYDICFCGRLTLQKNPLNFVEGIKLLKGKFKDIKAVMIGDGEMREEVEKKIKECDLTKNIKLTGFVKNPYEFMAKSKVFVSNSIFEGYGLVAFESLSLGLPIVVTDVGGLVNIVDEKSGYVYQNNTFLWTDIVESLLVDDKKLENYSLAAKKRANELDNTIEYSNKIIEIYESLI